MAIKIKNGFEVRWVSLHWFKDQTNRSNGNIKSAITEYNAPHVTEYLKFLNAISKEWFLGEIVVCKYVDTNIIKLIDGNRRLFFIEQLFSKNSIYKVYFNWRTNEFVEITDDVDLAYNIPVNIFCSTTALRQHCKDYVLEKLDKDVQNDFYDSIDDIGVIIDGVKVMILEINVHDSNNENSKKELREFLSFRNSTIV